MPKSQVYDLPTRLTHWLFAGLFVVAFAIANLVDDDSPWFSQHMLLGLILTFTALLRIGWGLVGSRYARFSELPLHPWRLVDYLRGVLSAKGASYFAHNPASAWAAVLMLALSLGLGLTGYQMAQGQKEAFEDIHELLANAFAIVVVAHIAGVVLHSLRHRDGLLLSMFNGNKDNVEGAPPLAGSHPMAALAMAGAVGLFAFHLYTNYDSAQGTTSVFGQTLQLGEHEAGGLDIDEDDDDHDED